MRSVPKCSNAVLKLIKNILLPPVVTKEIGGTLTFFSGTMPISPMKTVSRFGNMGSNFILVTTGGSLPDC